MSLSPSLLLELLQFPDSVLVAVVVVSTDSMESMRGDSGTATVWGNERVCGRLARKSATRDGARAGEGVVVNGNEAGSDWVDSVTDCSGAFIALVTPAEEGTLLGTSATVVDVAEVTTDDLGLRVEPEDAVDFGLLFITDNSDIVILE